jgi:hypothetical protein
LANNFTTTDPDILDFTFGDAENTIFNSSYSFKVGINLYQLKADGMYINGIPQEGGAAARTQAVACLTNVKEKKPFDISTTQRFKLKVSVTSIGLRSSARGKVVSFKKKSGGGWKRTRVDMAVALVGLARSNIVGACDPFETFNRRNSSTGFSRKKSVKTDKYRAIPSIYRVQKDELSSNF